MGAAITAVGAVTGHGLSADALLAAVLAGRTAVRPIERFSTVGLCSSLGAEGPAPEALLTAARPLLGRRPAEDRASALLLAAAAEALQGVELAQSERRAALVGTTKGALERWLEDWRSARPSELDPLASVATALARACGARGPVHAVGAACASSSVALGEALTLIERGEADQVVVGGVEAMHPFVYAGFHSLKALSARPAMPFDRFRSGLSLGEGAAVLLLESQAHSALAGRSILATLRGYGSAADGHDQTAPDPTGHGLLRACWAALTQAGLEPSDLGRYHAHGTATRYNDRMESAVVQALWGPCGVPVSGIKGSIGHTLGAAGALDVVACILSARRGLIPAITNSSAADAELEVDAVLERPRPQRNGRCLVATAGFGGINTALVLEANL